MCCTIGQDEPNIRNYFTAEEQKIHKAEINKLVASKVKIDKKLKEISEKILSIDAQIAECADENVRKKLNAEKKECEADKNYWECQVHFPESESGCSCVIL